MQTLEVNDTIEGTMAIAPNKKNHRDLDIVLDYQVKGSYPAHERREYRM